LEKRVTHLVVRPEQTADRRLVPIQLAKKRDNAQREIELGCTLEEAQKFESVHEAAYIRIGENPAQDPDWDIGVTDVMANPYYSSIGVGAFPDQLDPYGTMAYDRVPKGEIELRRASTVTSADGHSLGEVDGFLVDADEYITHLVLERGHLWGRKEVTIPIGAVARVESDAVYLTLSKDDVGALPTIHVGRHG
jgi:hypothetical protein